MNKKPLEKFKEESDDVLSQLKLVLKNKDVCVCSSALTQALLVYMAAIIASSPEKQQEAMIKEFFEKTEDLLRDAVQAMNAEVNSSV